MLLFLKQWQLLTLLRIADEEVGDHQLVDIGGHKMADIGGHKVVTIQLADLGGHQVGQVVGEKERRVDVT